VRTFHHDYAFLFLRGKINPYFFHTINNTVAENDEWLPRKRMTARRKWSRSYIHV
jgi:uncharacterized protein (UPF0303 family)